MSTEEQDKLQQQRDRRKRINRIKTGIIMTISIWMLVSFISIIVLCICLIKTNIKLNKFINSGVNNEVSSENQMWNRKKYPVKILMMHMQM